MNTQAIQKKLDNYMETATPEQVVKEFEDLGVEFVNTNDMNLIQQLQATPKWKEFEEWYNNYYLTNKHVPSLNTLEQVPYEMYKGVFEKFIEDTSPIGIDAEGSVNDLTYSWTKLPLNGPMEFEHYNSFEELLI